MFCIKKSDADKGKGENERAALAPNVALTKCLLDVFMIVKSDLKLNIRNESTYGQ